MQRMALVCSMIVLGCGAPPPSASPPVDIPASTASKTVSAPLKPGYWVTIRANEVCTKRFCGRDSRPTGGCCNTCQFEGWEVNGLPLRLAAGLVAPACKEGRCGGCENSWLGKAERVDDGLTVERYIPMDMTGVPEPTFDDAVCLESGGSMHPITGRCRCHPPAVLAVRGCSTHQELCRWAGGSWRPHFPGSSDIGCFDNADVDFSVLLYLMRSSAHRDEIIQQLGLSL